VIGLCFFDENGSLTGMEFHPVVIGGSEGLKQEALDQRIAPEIAIGEDAQRILRRFQSQCALLGTQIRISDDAAFYDVAR
jgi:poly-gamma-glutamate synthesis protein (capsule biosynthesis protein)